MRDKPLYRDPINGKLTGVCAGVANYFNIEIWLVRILVVSVALLGASFLIIVTYIVLTLMLEKQPHEYQQTIKAEQGHKLKSKAWKVGQTPDSLLSNMEKELESVDKSVRAVEAYVTSDAFKVNSELNKL